MPRVKPEIYIEQMADQEKWADEAACRGEDARLFDTVKVNTLTWIDDDVRTAMDICADCPVMVRCLEHAIRFDVTHGVWGGMVYEARLAWALEHHPEWLSDGARRKADGLDLAAVLAA